LEDVRDAAVERVVLVRREGVRTDDFKAAEEREAFAAAVVRAEEAVRCGLVVVREVA
jgi:hypothetical protein